MPIYQCATSKTLSPETRAAIAKEITRIHVEFIGAPEPFVNVVFSALPLGSHYLAGAVRENGTLINAIVRAGRTLETRQALLKSLSAAWSRLTGQPERNLILKVEEADPAVIMEAGLIMPRPGEEAAWLEANKAVLAEAGRRVSRRRRKWVTPRSAQKLHAKETKRRGLKRLVPLTRSAAPKSQTQGPFGAKG